MTRFVTFGRYRVTGRTSYIASMKLSLMMIIPLLHACSDADPKPDADLDPGPAARAAFRDTFEAQRYQDLPAALETLAAADAASPDDPDTVLLQALGNLWFVAELGRDPSRADQVPAVMAAAMQHFGRMRTLRPDDHRVLGWFGAVQIGAGQQTQNPALTAAGQQMVAEGVAAYPEFNLFVHSLVYSGYPVGSPQFDSAVDAFHATNELCFGPLDRDNPDVTPYLGKVTTTGRQRVCWNDPYAVHNFEGYFLEMGDVLVKAGKLDTARRAYQNAQLSETYDQWPYRGLLVERLATIEARGALYADADPANDPLMISQTEVQCASCHAR